jgi:hypothetical protein
LRPARGGEALIARAVSGDWGETPRLRGRGGATEAASVCEKCGGAGRVNDVFTGRVHPCYEEKEAH